MIQRLRNTLRIEEGATAVEYGIMVALIAVVIIAAVFALGESVSDTFDCTGDAITAADGSVTCPGGTTTP